MALLRMPCSCAARADAAAVSRSGGAVGIKGAGGTTICLGLGGAEGGALPFESVFPIATHQSDGCSDAEPRGCANAEPHRCTDAESHEQP